MLQSIKEHKHRIIREYATPDDARAFLEVASTLVPLGLLWWAAVRSWHGPAALTAIIVLLLSLLMIRVLVLMHECGHGSFFRSRWLNRAFGFLFGALSGMPQYVWSQHHAFHHANNGNWERFRGPLTSPSVAEYAAMTPRQQWLYRFPRNIWFAPLAGFVYLIANPRLTWIKGSLALALHVARAKIAEPGVPLRRHAATFRTRYWNSPRELRHMTANNLAVLSGWALMGAAVGAGPFFAIYVASVSLAGGVGIALFTVQHNFEHAYASDSANWDFDAGAMQGSSYLVLPRWLHWVTANIGYHHIHHLSARIPSYRLPACHHANRELFATVTRVPLSGICGSLQCLLWDERARRIISFGEYDRRQAGARPER
jgi:omega-6 fatty acid desaturase (delta-12 desaturase)